MAKAKIVIDTKEDQQVWIFCPGCETHHAFTTRHPGFHPWTWNNDLEKPTFNPSMLVNRDFPESRCHSFIRDGYIQFLGDCFHQLKNKKVLLPDLDI